MPLVFTKDVTIGISDNPEGESANVEARSATDLRVRYTLRDTEGKAYVVEDIDFLTFPCSISTENRGVLVAELRAHVAGLAGFSVVP